MVPSHVKKGTFYLFIKKFIMSKDVAFVAKAYPSLKANMMSFIKLTHMNKNICKLHNANA